MTPSEMNRMCAEGLGLKLQKKERVYGSRGEWYEKKVAIEPPDFLHSEAANAMLLEAMRGGTQYVGRIFRQASCGPPHRGATQGRAGGGVKTSLLFLYFALGLAGGAIPLLYSESQRMSSPGNIPPNPLFIVAGLLGMVLGLTAALLVIYKVK